jgi:enolase-phosphatase E1
MPRFILLDIEGTTTDIDFVHKVLFPYAAERLEAFIKANGEKPEVQAAIRSVKETVQTENNQELDDEGVIDTLLEWIADDRKHGTLKTLQGMIWETGFRQGDYRGHVYPDVPVALQQWKEQGIDLGIYSSGSVQAQKLLFGHSEAGDLTPLFSHYFDTTVGGKKEPDSYAKIAAALQLSPSDILFLSDVEAELDAAAQAGFQVMQLVRGEPVASKYPQANSFADIELQAAGMIC